MLESGIHKASAWDKMRCSGIFLAYHSSYKILPTQRSIPIIDRIKTLLKCIHEKTPHEFNMARFVELDSLEDGLIDGSISLPSMTENKLKLPILDILMYLDWPTRIRLIQCLREIDIDPEPGFLPQTWIFDRLVEESYIQRIAQFDLPRDHYLELRLGIVGSLSVSTHIRIPRMSSSVIVFGCAVDPAESNVISKRVELSSADAEPRNFARVSYDRRGLFPGMVNKKTSRVPRHSYHLAYSYRDQSVTTQVSEFSFRTFRIGSLNVAGDPCIDEVTLSEFVNGRTTCIIIGGAQSDAKKHFGQFILAHIPILDIAFRERRSFHPTEKYQCFIHSELNQFTKSGMETLWSSDWPFTASMLQEVMSAVDYSLGHACFRVSVHHRFSNPPGGSHENHFTIVIPRNGGSRATRILNLDVLALRRSLRAIKCQQSFVPIRDSKLTAYVRPDTCDSIRIIVCVSNASDISRQESLYGLRFAEQFSSRCTL